MGDVEFYLFLSFRSDVERGKYREGKSFILTDTIEND